MTWLPCATAIAIAFYIGTVVGFAVGLIFPFWWMRKGSNS